MCNAQLLAALVARAIDLKTPKRNTPARCRFGDQDAHFRYWRLNLDLKIVHDVLLGFAHHDFAGG